MRDQCLKYSSADVDVVTMAPGERYLFRQDASSASFGVFYLYGYTTMVEGAVPGRVFNSVGEWRPNAADGWSNDVVGHDAMLLEAGPEGAQWICISSNGSGAREIQHVHVTDSAFIPAGCGVLVAAGEISFGSVVAQQFQYIRPREADMLVSGAADLLLLR